MYASRLVENRMKPNTCVGGGLFRGIFDGNRDSRVRFGIGM